MKTKTITRRAEPQPHPSIVYCTSGEFAVVGFDADDNVIDANLTLLGKYVGDIIRIQEDVYDPQADRVRPTNMYYVIDAARLVLIDTTWYWIIDASHDPDGEARLKFNKAWHWLGENAKSYTASYLPDIADPSDTAKRAMQNTLGIIAAQIKNGNYGDYIEVLSHIAVITAVLYSYEETQQ
jgi:hypothetical protein